MEEVFFFAVYFGMTREEKLNNFNPSAPSYHPGQLFGLPFTAEESEIVVIPVPWDVTTSYNPGTSNAITGILKASQQIDLFDPTFPNGWQKGIALAPLSKNWKEENKRLRPKVEAYLELLETGSANAETDSANTIQEVNRTAASLRENVKSQTLDWLEKGKKPVLLGGDHSCPLGYIEALATKYPGMGILQIDAHLDMRHAYEGFQQSHASIMHNALQLDGIEKLVAVGIRDYCEGELECIKEHPKNIEVFFDRDLKKAAFSGIPWNESISEIISHLPDRVYLSFDIDGLDPKLCPNTGTPVPGGLEFEQALALIEQLKIHGKTLVGFDLCEVGTSDNQWDENVGARILFRLAHCLLDHS